VRKAFDIVYDIISNNYVRYRRDETSIWTVLLITFDIDGMPPSISNKVTFDIEHLRYQCTISNVKNVDIEWAFDIEVFDIECFVRYRRSNTRYRASGCQGSRWCLRQVRGRVYRVTIWKPHHLDETRRFELYTSMRFSYWHILVPLYTKQAWYIPVYTVITVSNK
jgi:hypothetical protein